MKIYEIPFQLKKINRLRQIAGTLARYQIVSASKRIWRNNPVALIKRALRDADRFKKKQPPAAAIRKVVEELGTTYIKFGQWLSVRPDFVPPEVIEELEKLQDRLPPVPFKVIRKALEQEYGRSLDEMFFEFEADPLSTASIAQVHRAVLKSGERVAVKVQHPDLKERIDVDLSILRSVADWGVKNWPHLSLHRPEDLISSFKEILMDEVDFTVEAKNQARIAEMFLETPWCHIPKVHWQYTTERILVMEYLDGFKITHRGIPAGDEYDPKLIARRLSNCFFRQIFEHGVFHSDPHPGNILFMKDNQIGVVDFGIVSKFDDKLLGHLIDWFYAAIYRDVDLFADTFLQVVTSLEPVDRSQFRTDCIDYLDEMHFQPAHRISFARLLAATNQLLYRHKISAPPTFLFFFKAISTLEGVARRVDPGFDWRHHWGPRLRKIIEERYSPERVAKDQWKVLRDYNRLISEYPDDLRDIIKTLKDGSYEVEVHGYRDYIETQRKGYTRIALSMITCSMILGIFLLGYGKGVTNLWDLHTVLPGLPWALGFLLILMFLFSRR